MDLGLNFKIDGVKINADFLHLDIRNMDRLFILFPNKALRVLNRIMKYFHSFGSCYHGEIFNRKKLILWQNESSIDYRKSYTQNLCYKQYMKESLKKNDNINIKTPSVDLTCLPYLCTFKLLTALCEDEGLMKIIKHYKISINLVLHSGEVIYGFEGSPYKIDELLVVNRKLQYYQTKERNKKFFPKMVFSEQYYNRLSYEAKKTLYPMIANSESIYNLHYQQFFNYLEATKQQYNKPKNMFPVLKFPLININSISDAILFDPDFVKYTCFNNSAFQPIYLLIEKLKNKYINEDQAFYPLLKEVLQMNGGDYFFNEMLKHINKEQK
jgi:hypothetical protein